MAAFFCAGLIRIMISQSERLDFEDYEDFYDSAEEFADMAKDVLKESDGRRQMSFEGLSHDSTSKLAS